jgi:uncharacterized alkaline shock family protein YloU
VTDGQSVISPDVLARYAADAAREVPGVHDVTANGVKVTRADGQLSVELHLTLDWSANAPTVGAQVQARVAEVLAGMADARPETVDVVVDEWRSASSA